MKRKLLLKTSLLIGFLAVLFVFLRTQLNENLWMVQAVKAGVKARAEQPTEWPLRFEPKVCSNLDSELDSQVTSERLTRMGAVVKLACGDAAAAADQLYKIYAEKPADQSTGFLLGAAYYSLGQVDQAFAVWSQFGLDAIRFFIWQSKSGSLALKPEEALPWLNAARGIVNFPPSIDFYEEYVWGCIGFREAKYFEEAIFSCESLVKFHPENPQNILLLGRAYLGAKDFSNAETEFLQSVMLLPEDAAGYFYLGQAQEGLGKTEKAWVSYLKSVSLSEDYCWARMRLAELEQQQKNTEKAIDYYKQVLGHSTDAFCKSQAILRLNHLGGTYP